MILMTGKRTVQLGVGLEREGAVFAAYEDAAAAGLRCPTNPEISGILKTSGFKNTSTGGIPAVTRRLIEKGRIVVRVYGHNYKVVEILTGPYVGKSTAPPGHAGQPYAVLDATEMARRSSQLSLTV